MPGLVLQNLNKHFDGVAALDNLSLEIPAGQITGLIGPNGSGKSTLINVLTGLIEKDAGTVKINGFKLETIRSSDVALYGLTRTFQDMRLIEQMSVLDNILFVLTERNSWSAIFERHSKYHLEAATKILMAVGLDGKINEHAQDLSYGQRKLLEIARVLAMDAKIILLDEPFAGLFPHVVEKLVQIIVDLRSRGKTIVLVEHNMQLIKRLCDHLVVLDSGLLLAQGKPDKVLAHRSVIEAYLGD